MIKVLWTHTFSPAAQNSGIFMFQLIEPLREQGVEVIPVYIGGIKRNPLKFICSIPEIIQKARGCDLVHAQYGSMCGLLSIFLPKKKILSLRGSDWYGIAGSGLKIKLHSFLATAMSNISVPFYKKIIVMSERMAKEVKDKHLNSSVCSLADGIDLQKFSPMDKITARKKLGIDENSPYILFTSNDKNNQVKRIWLALEAVEIAKKTFPNLKILIAEGIEHNLMPLYVNACDLTVLTSSHEGWPNCIKEALACNVPFVATDVSDLKDIATNTTDCKVVNADAEKIAQAIIEVLKFDGEHNLRTFVSNMNIDEYTQKLKSIYTEIIQNT